MTLDELDGPWLSAGAIALGLLFGSFLNVVIHRLPRDQSVVFPGSSCPSCGTKITPWDNIPVLSWALLRGRARCCGAPIALRYPLVELLGGLAAWSVLRYLVLSRGELGWEYGLLLFAVYLYFVLALVAALFIDFEYMILPDSITFGLFAVGLATAPVREEPLIELLWGSAVGFLVVWLPFVWGYAKLRGHPGMGMGDAKLLLGVGAWFGATGVVFALLAGAVQGTLFALVAYVVQGRVEEPEKVKQERQELLDYLEQLPPEERAELEAEMADDPLMSAPSTGLGKARVAFGPFLALAALEYLYFGDWLVASYLVMAYPA